MNEGGIQPASTARPVASVAQSRDGGVAAAPGLAAAASTAPPAPPQRRHVLGPNIARTITRAAPPLREQPLYRPLRIYTSDPSASRLEAAITTVNVPYERLAPGPEGRLFRVDNHDPSTGEDYVRADLDAPYALLGRGYEPAPSDVRFHQQMVYAVCSNVYAAFRVALGRELTWGFERTQDANRLWLQPHAFRGMNAHYDKTRGTLCFGYDTAPDLKGAIRVLPGEYVFSCLSHDVIAHEVTHAILDGMRSNFSIPSGPDVAAFHEAIADLVAIFQRLGYRELVRSAICRARGTLEQASSLAELARQIGYAAGRQGPLRDVIDADPPPCYDECLEPHELGAVLVAAVFEAFLVVYRRKAARYLRLATGGTGILPPGEIPPDLADILAEKISELASQFQVLLIRAIDYCPPVDIRLGEFLRALITADHDLVPDDPWGYREALIDAFLRRAILPRGVHNLSESALLWNPPRMLHPPLAMLSFRELRFDGDPGCPACERELLRQADVLGEYVTRPEVAREFGLLPQDAPGFAPGSIELPAVTSIRSARRVGPDGQIVFDLVAEVVQACRSDTASGVALETYGGCTVILAPDGALRYAISKSLLGAERLERRMAFVVSAQGRRYWKIADGSYRLRGRFFSLLHEAAAE